MSSDLEMPVVFSEKETINYDSNGKNIINRKLNKIITKSTPSPEGSIVKKAYEINLDRLDEGYLSDNIICYAESQNKARRILLKQIKYDYWTLKNGEELNYLNIPVIRRKSSDIVIFEGQEVNRSLIPEIIYERERIIKLQDILNNPDVKYCYIVKGDYYRPNAAGYTSYRDEAGIYPKIEAVQQAMSCREIRLELIDIQEHNKMINDKISKLKEKLLIETCNQTEAPIVTNNNPTPANQKIISSVDEFEAAINDFINYKPIKVAKGLKKNFLEAISAHFRMLKLSSWEATCFPLKKYWRIERSKASKLLNS